MLRDLVAQLKKRVLNDGATPNRWAAVLVATTLVVVVFPDVLFLNASIRPSRLLGQFGPADGRSSFWPEREGRRLNDGYSDLGAAAWQAEPTQFFLRNSIQALESPYWNPFSAAGTPGVETVENTAFSFLSILIAVLGPGSTSFHVVHFAFLGLALYCLFRALTVHLGASFLASVAACFFFMLSGYHTTFLASQISQPYVLAPILFYALLRFSSRATVPRFIGAILANSLILAETFLPSALLTMISVHALAASFSLCHPRDPGPHLPRLRGFALQGMTAVLGFLLLAPVWFPIFESLHTVATWDYYNARPHQYLDPRFMLTLFTPKHFWEAYSGLERIDHEGFQLAYADIRGFYHLGITPVLLAVHVLAKKSSRSHPVVLMAGLLVIFSLGRVFGVFPFSLIDHAPALKVIHIAYWGVMWSLPFFVLVAFGVDAVSKVTVWRWPTQAAYGIFGALVLFLTVRIGIPKANHLVLYVAIVVAILVVSGILFALIRMDSGRQAFYSRVLVLVTVAELVFYTNSLRPRRTDREYRDDPMVAFVREHVGNARILNIGQRGLLPNWGSAFGIAQAGSLNSTYLPWYRGYFKKNFDTDGPIQLAIRDLHKRKDSELNREGLNLLGIRYLLISRHARNYLEQVKAFGFELVFETQLHAVYENPDYYPRAFAVPALMESVQSPDVKGWSNRDVASTQSTLLLRRARSLGIPIVAGSSPVEVPHPSRVEIISYRNAEVILDVSLAQPSIVVLADTWHPNWSATANGEPVHVALVDRAFRGVALPAGRATVVLSYAPRTLRAGVIVAGLVILSFPLLLILRRQRRWRAV